jgi:hypothetical protein
VPRELLALVGEQIDRVGRRAPMPFPRDGAQHFYPLCVGDARPRLPAGSIVLTGTPEGVALKAPGPVGVTLRGIVRLRSPFEQFLAEERDRVEEGERGRYLKPGDRVIARIDGLGAQEFEIAAAGADPGPDPCRR